MIAFKEISIHSEVINLLEETINLYEIHRHETVKLSYKS